MKYISKYINFVLLVFGAILSSNIDGSIKTFGIIILVFTITKMPSTKYCFNKFKRQHK